MPKSRICEYAEISYLRVCRSLASAGVTMKVRVPLVIPAHSDHSRPSPSSPLPPVIPAPPRHSRPPVIPAEAGTQKHRTTMPPASAGVTKGSVIPAPPRHSRPPVIPAPPSFPRKREPRSTAPQWLPALAGMTPRRRAKRSARRGLPAFAGMTQLCLHEGLRPPLARE